MDTKEDEKPEIIVLFKLIQTNRALCSLDQTLPFLVLQSSDLPDNGLLKAIGVSIPNGLSSIVENRTTRASSVWCCDLLLEKRMA